MKKAAAGSHFLLLQNAQQDQRPSQLLPSVRVSQLSQLSQPPHDNRKSVTQSMHYIVCSAVCSLVHKIHFETFQFQLREKKNVPTGATSESQSHSDVEGGGCREGGREGSDGTGGTNGTPPSQFKYTQVGLMKKKKINSSELLQERRRVRILVGILQVPSVDEMNGTTATNTGGMISERKKKNKWGGSWFEMCDIFFPVA